ncbi:response regulator transcription factor [Alteromonas facilis]|uniref:response regulator transcription factor n=1 Tax=Alteromonas facilis TaxID=2048004 RepID=UPI000C28F7AC|nr:response regulator transcription factor [Alteromonas facilis]
MQGLSILLVEDTVQIATEVCDYLASQGARVDYASTGKQGLALAIQHDFDVIILDVMLPDLSGIKVCEQIKQLCEPVPPVLMLTARDSINDKAEGFDAGADDYLTKPFELQELALRCKALARRQQLHQSHSTFIGDLCINEKQQTVEREGKPIRLSQTDFKILLLLVHAYPNAVSRQQIINKVWGDDMPDSDVLRSHIYTLRQSLDKSFAAPMLQTLHGIGFKLSVPE